jgi:hypothetical protein
MQISASQASPSAASIPNAFAAPRVGAIVGGGAQAVRGAAASMLRPATLRWARTQALRLVTLVAGH